MKLFTQIESQSESTRPELSFMCGQYSFYIEEGHQVKHGPRKKWFRNGCLKADYNYKHGYRDGLYKTWHADGRPNWKAYYEEKEEYKSKEECEVAKILRRSW